MRSPRSWFFEHMLRRPLLTVVAGVALTSAAAGGLARLELRTDGRALVPREAPEILEDRAVRDLFDLEDQIAVVVETRDPAGVFNPRSLQRLAELTDALRGVEGVDPEEVTSLATERSHRSGRNALAFRTFLDPLPRDADALARFRDEIVGMGIYSGTLLSLDARAAAILVGVEPGADRPALVRRIRAAVVRIAGPAALADAAPTGDEAGAGVETIHIVGAPVVESLLGRHILEDLATLVPLGVLLMGLLFLWRYRRLAAVVLPLTEVGACLVFVFGCMGYAGVPVSLALTVMPVILTGVGVADEIHLFDRYALLASRAEDGAPRRQVLLRTLEEMWRPVVKTSVTTALAFLSFALSPIVPVRHFGVFTAVGVLFCMAWSLTVVPAGLALARRGPGATAVGAWPDRFARLPGWVRRHRLAVLVATGLILAAAPVGLVRVRVQDSWIDGFAATSPLRRSTETVNRLFFGTHLLRICFDAGPAALAGELRELPAAVENSDGDARSSGVPGRLGLLAPVAGELDPAALIGEQVLFDATPARLAGRLRREPEFFAEIVAAHLERGAVGVELVPRLDPRGVAFLGSHAGRRWSFFATGERLLDPRLLARVGQTADFVAARLERGGEGGGVLGPHAQLAAARFLLRGSREKERRTGETPIENRNLLSAFEEIRGDRRGEEVFDAGRQRALITVFLENANFVAVRRLMEATRSYAREELAPLGVRLRFAGDVAVSQAMIGAIVSTQVRSLLLSLLGVWVLASAWGGSLRWGSLCVLPPALAVVILFAAMGALGIPLGVATSMFAAMTLGIGVDFAIHLTERLRAPEAGRAAVEPGAPGRISRAVAVTGPAIAMNALVVATGFGVLLLSRVPANGRLGLFVLSSVLTCLGATLVLVPWMAGPLLAEPPPGRQPGGRPGNSRSSMPAS